MEQNANNKTKKDKVNLFKKGDIIILVLLIAAIILSIVFLVSDGDGDVVSVYINGSLTYYLAFDENTSLELLDGAMTIEIKDGEVSVTYSNCPEQICVESVPLTSSGGVIICLPNKVSIVIESGEVDVIT